MVDKLSAGGARVADVGCGHGASTIMMATAFPASTFHGTDAHAASVQTARDRANAAAPDLPVTFDVTGADGMRGGPYDLITMFDCLHDMGDPIGAARRVREVIADDGTWMIVEPAAGDHVEDNFNPIGRAYYGFSTLLCTPVVVGPAGRIGAGHAGRSGADPRCGDRRRFHPVPARGPDPPVQQRFFEVRP